MDQKKGILNKQNTKKAPQIFFVFLEHFISFTKFVKL